MEIGWSLLGDLPVEELHRLSETQIAEHIEAQEQSA
jgi:vacuolar-type H+-ATPase subunit B/Vma2